jgi:hypothetical protein
VKKILILTANPVETTKLRLDEEVREIQEGLQRSRRRESFEIIARLAVRQDDLRRALLDHEPHIVHFSGHGVGSDGLVLENDDGTAKPVSTEALARLFALFSNTVECVLLNACYSEVQAEAIHQHIDYVVGMNRAIGDSAAIEFAKGFYDGLGAGRAYEEAFEFGLTGIDLEGLPEVATPVLKQRGVEVSSPGETAESEVTSARIFISYKRDVAEDEPLALALYEALGKHHQVFIDQTMAVGTRWVERIENELKNCDFLITLLSAQSVHSEMVFGEVETAHTLCKATGKPRILPVRVAYREPFAYPLSAYVDPINWAVWDSDADTARLIEELEQAIAGGDLSIQTPASKANLLQSAEKTETPPPSAAQLKPPVALEPAEGTMDPESQLYVTRPSDDVALSTIQRQGVTITIKGPRQMGKSSLLMRTMDAALHAGKRVAFIDFQLFDRNILKNADRFYQAFCGTIAEQLDLPNSVAEFWQRSGGNVQRCTRYMQLHILKPLGEPLLLAMDEVDRMFDADFGTDFFSMLRSWHNNRALPMYRIWKQFDLALVTATEPYHLIADLNQSPFNVGEVIALKDFDAEQVSDLNQRHGSPLTSAQEQQLMALLQGHPYLVRRALYLLAKPQITVADLFKTASTDRSPFRDHLSYHLFRIYDKQELVHSLLQIIRTHTCPDERVARLLLAAGLVRRQDERLVPRCQLYADYFQKHLHE